jgi:flagellar biosynthesis protein
MDETPHNPKTAVALRYDPVHEKNTRLKNTAPCVVASGSGCIAENILRIARENDIPLRQDPALAGALATLDVGQEIPGELFRAVAEVLAFVYNLNGKK